MRYLKIGQVVQGDAETRPQVAGLPVSSTAGPAEFEKSGVLFPTEERKRFESFHKRIWDELGPEGALQGIFANRIISLSWRLGNLHIFRDAQAARKEHRAFLRETLLETLAARNRYESEITRKQIESLLKRKNGSVDENSDSHAASLKGEEKSEKEGEQTTKPSDEWDVRELNDAFQNMMQAFTNVLGSDAIKKVEEGKINGLPIELAFLADAVTVENCLNELGLATALERAIDENLERLRNLQGEKYKRREASKSRSRMMPPYD